MNDAVNLAVAVTLMVIPAVLKFNPGIKKWIKVVCLAVIVALILTKVVWVWCLCGDNGTLDGEKKDILTPCIL